MLAPWPAGPLRSGDSPTSRAPTRSAVRGPSNCAAGSFSKGRRCGHTIRPSARCLRTSVGVALHVCAGGCGRRRCAGRRDRVARVPRRACRRSGRDVKGPRRRRRQPVSWCDRWPRHAIYPGFGRRPRLFGQRPPAPPMTRTYSLSGRRRSSPARTRGSAWRLRGPTSRPAPASCCARETRPGSQRRARRSRRWPRPASRSWRGAPTCPTPLTSKSLVSATLEGLGGLQVLVNNAGVYGPMGPIEDVDWDEWVRAIEINCPARSSRAARCCRTSRRGATARSSSCPAAARPIRCRASRPTPRRRRRSSASPRALALEVKRRRDRRERHRAGRAQHADDGRGARRRRRRRSARPSTSAWPSKAEGGTPLETGAALAVFLGSAASDGITGRLLSAVWDPVGRRCPQHRADLDAHRRLHAAAHRPRRTAASTWGEQVSLGVAIVGCGLIGRKRAAALAGRAAGRVRRPRSCDRAEALARARRRRAARCHDWREAIARPDVDVVIVATTNDALAEVAQAALEAGKHVLVEKPAARERGRDRAADRRPRARTGRLVRVGLQSPLPSRRCGRRASSCDSGASWAS